jgi:hypothetical protein
MKRDPPEWEFISLEGELRRKRKFAGDLVLAFAEFPVRFLLAKLDVAVAAGENSYENFCLFAAHFYWYGADANFVCEYCACRDGKRLRRTRRLLRKSYSQRRASKLLCNDGGSSSIAIWYAGSRLSQ